MEEIKNVSGIDMLKQETVEPIQPEVEVTCLKTEHVDTPIRPIEATVPWHFGSPNPNLVIADKRLVSNLYLRGVIMSAVLGLLIGRSSIGKYFDPTYYIEMLQSWWANRKVNVDADMF